MSPRARRAACWSWQRAPARTYTAFQIIWRLWKAGNVKRVLFLADRNILVNQAQTNDFEPFGTVMMKVAKRAVNKSYEVYLALYQAVTGTEEEQDVYKQFSRDFLDLIVIDECHRGSPCTSATPSKCSTPHARDALGPLFHGSMHDRKGHDAG